MKERIIKIAAQSLILFAVIAVLVALYTGSAARAEQPDAGQLSVAVIDKRGVGQTRKEIESGMNDDVTYDRETKTLSWKIGDDYELLEDYTYYITFKVEDGEVGRTEAKR